AGWVVVIEEWLRGGRRGGALCACAGCGWALVPVALGYGRLAQRMPEAASEIAYTAAVFPPAVSFLAGWTMTFAYLVVCPYEAVAISQLAAYLVPDLKTLELYKGGEYIGYPPYVGLTLGTTIVIAFINYRGIRLSAHFQNWTTFGLLAVFFIFVPLGWWRGSYEQMQPLFKEGELNGVLLSTLAVLPIVPYF